MNIMYVKILLVYKYIHVLNYKYRYIDNRMEEYLSIKTMDDKSPYFALS
jgi:hypothetical protein